MEFLKTLTFIIALASASLLNAKPFQGKTKEQLKKETNENIIPPPEKFDLIFNNELDNLIAPFTYNSSLYLLGGATLAYAIFETDFERKKEERRLSKTERKSTWSEAGNIVGWGLLPVGYSLIEYFSYRYGDSSSLHLQHAEYMIKTVAYTGLMTLALKVLIDQRRPKDRLKEDSFPSGHASSGFAFSTAVWLTHGWKWGLFATTLATWVSYSRVWDGSHYYHDTIAGAALGVAYALGIYHNHYKRDLPFILSFSPIPGESGGVAQVSFDF